MFTRTSDIISSEPPRQILETAIGDGTPDDVTGAPFDARTRRSAFVSDRAPASQTRAGSASPHLIPSKCAAVKRLMSEIELVARTPATVLLCGETGVGKEVFAQAIHDLSPRRTRHMVRVNCGAIPATLVESEFFGHERGAYTGAFNRQIGRFESAHQSTLLLDEIAELPPPAQVKLLRVLQERVIERLGSPHPVKVDVRIIAATNVDLEQAVSNGTFREDLFYRLNVFPLWIPPLRERAEDIPALAWEFVNELSRSLNKRIESICPDSMRDMQRYRWPGNVRELRNTIERAMIIATGPVLTVRLSPMLRAVTSRHANPSASAQAS